MGANVNPHYFGSFTYAAHFAYSMWSKCTRNAKLLNIFLMQFTTKIFQIQCFISVRILYSHLTRRDYLSTLDEPHFAGRTKKLPIECSMQLLRLFVPVHASVCWLKSIIHFVRTTNEYIISFVHSPSTHQHQHISIYQQSNCVHPFTFHLCSTH